MIGYLLGRLLADVNILQEMILRGSFFRDEYHGLFRISGHDLFANEDIGKWLKIVNELGVIVGKEQIVVQSLGQIG